MFTVIDVTLPTGRDRRRYVIGYQYSHKRIEESDTRKIYYSNDVPQDLLKTPRYYYLDEEGRFRRDINTSEYDIRND